MKIQNIKPAKARKLLRQILFSATVFLFSTESEAADYYWVGGTGNWSDFAIHWATTSGGSAFHTWVPDSTDDVYFDSNSGLNNGIVTLDILFSNRCHDLNFLSSIGTNYKLDLDSNQLSVWGSLQILDSGLTDVISNGNLAFWSSDVSVKTINCKSSLGCQVMFYTNSTYNFISDFKNERFDNTASTDFFIGTYNFNNINLTGDGYVFYGPSFTDFKKSRVDARWVAFWDQSAPHAFIVDSALFGSIIPLLALVVHDTSLRFSYVNSHDVISRRSFYKYVKAFVFSGDSNQVDLLNCSMIGATMWGGTHNHIKKLISDGFLSLDVAKQFIDTLFLAYNDNFYIHDQDTLFINDQIYRNGGSGQMGLLRSSPGNFPAYISKTSGTICFDNFSIENIHAIGGAQFFSGPSAIDLGGNAGWQFSTCNIVSDVWPGDANYDLTANNTDVLNIGLAYGETGPVRAGASNTWIAQPATDWSSFFQSAVNKKHADCDGNGVVDNNDTLAISLNYGFTHPARLADPNSNQSTSPPLYLIANPDTVMEGDTVEVDIYLGTQLIPVDSIYGIAFTINFDTALVDTSWMPFDFSGSWMGTPGVDLLPYDKKLFSQGKADVALTRTDHANIGGYGYLGKMGAVIVDNVGTRLTTSPPYITLPLSISNLTALTANEFYLTISTGIENIEIDTLGITGIHQPYNANQPFTVYPNPVHTKLTVNSYWLKGETNCMVEIYNVIGEKIITEQIPVSQNRFSMDVSTVPQGMYFIKVVTAKGTVNKKILVIKK